MQIFCKQNKSSEQQITNIDSRILKKKELKVFLRLYFYILKGDRYRLGRNASWVELVMGETHDFRLNTYEFSLPYCCAVVLCQEPGAHYLALLALCSEQLQDHLKQLTHAVG